MIKDSDFAVQNVENWEDVTEEARGFGKSREPDGVRQWSSLGKMKHMLNSVASPSMSINYMFTPTPGGVTLEYVTGSAEDGCLELHTGACVYLVNPEVLEFHTFGENRPEWSCFRLECGEMDETEVGEPADGHESLAERRPGSRDYIELWEYNQKRDELPSGAREVWRWHDGGTFLVVPKGGDYNHVTAHSDARHNDMSSDEFREYIRGGIEEVEG